MEDLKRMVDSGMYVSALRHFQERMNSGELGTADLGWGYHFASVACYRLNDLHTAREYGERAANLGNEIGDYRLEMKAWFNLVEYCQRIGDTHLALDYADKWLSRLDQVPEEALRSAKVRYNLALVYRSRRDPEEALRQFRLALDSAPQSNTEFRLLTMQMIAWLLYETGRLDEGDQIVQNANRIIGKTDTRVDIVREQLLLQAWREYHLQNHMNCLDLCREFLEGETTLYQRFWAAAMIAGAAIQLYPDDAKILSELKQAAFFYVEMCGQLALELKETRLLNHYNRIRQRVKARWSDYLAG